MGETVGVALSDAPDWIGFAANVFTVLLGTAAAFGVVLRWFPSARWLLLGAGFRHAIRRHLRGDTEWLEDLRLWQWRVDVIDVLTLGATFAAGWSAWWSILRRSPPLWLSCVAIAGGIALVLAAMTYAYWPRLDEGSRAAREQALGHWWFAETMRLSCGGALLTAAYVCVVTWLADRLGGSLGVAVWLASLVAVGAAWVAVRVARDRQEPFSRVVRTESVKRLDGLPDTPADAVGELFALPFMAEHLGTTGPRHSWHTLCAEIEAVSRTASTAGAYGLLARLLYPDDVRTLRVFFDGVAEHLRRFGRSEDVNVDLIPGLSARNLVPRSGAAANDDDDIRYAAEQSFAAFATQLSGATVMVDSLPTRSHYFDEVLLLHSRAFRHSSRSHARPREAFDTSDRYENHHDGTGCELPPVAAAELKAGDFDRQVLTFRGLSVAQSDVHGRVYAVLRTSETCYRATEGLKGDEGTACKKLPFSVIDPVPLVSAPAHPPATSLAYRIDRLHPDAGQVTIVTSYVTLVTSDDQVVLCKRSMKVRNGPGVISATAGGVIEPNRPGAFGDVDESGMPSALSCVIRETKEEIGLDLPSDQVKPVVVFLANSRKRSSKDGTTFDKGQLVATVLHFCSVSWTFEQLKDRSNEADPSLGAFEVESLVAYATRCGVRSHAEVCTCSEGVTARLASAAARDARQLDQHGLLSLLYAAALLEDAAAAKSAFRTAFPTPWWDERDLGSEPASWDASFAWLHDLRTGSGDASRLRLAAVTDQLLDSRSVAGV